MNASGIRREWFAIVLAAAGTHAARAQTFQFVSRLGEVTVYCGAPSGGPFIDHRFQTSDPTDDTISVSDPGGPNMSASSAQTHLDAALTGSTLVINGSGGSIRSGTAGGAYAAADSRDNWTMSLSAPACFRLTISLEYTTSDPGSTQAFNFGASAGALIHLSDGTVTSILTHAIASGSWSGEFSGTLSPGQYFLTIFGRSEGNGSPFNGSFQTSAALALVSCPCSADFNNDGDVGTDADIEAFFACLGGDCCATCGSADFNNDGDVGTDADIESFFRVLGGGAC
jgi:hypothetical protein